MRKISDHGCCFELCQDDLRFIVEEVKSGLVKLNLQMNNRLNHGRSQSGKLSGEIRQEEAEKKWKSIKPALLKLAKDNNSISANKVAELAAVNKIITETEISNIAKKIRNDMEFKPYLKVRK